MQPLHTSAGELGSLAMLLFGREAVNVAQGRLLTLQKCHLRDTTPPHPTPSLSLNRGFEPLLPPNACLVNQKLPLNPDLSIREARKVTKAMPTDPQWNLPWSWWGNLRCRDAEQDKLPMSTFKEREDKPAS